MARKDALIRLHKRLLARRDALRKALAGQLSDLAKGGATGDIADIAFDIGAGEISSQLAELEARELQLVERALEKLEQGTYGICELCGQKIPVARLNAMPYCVYCIKCQREVERNPNWHQDRRDARWDRVYDQKVFRDEEEPEISLSDLEIDLSH
ncbi:MAG: hypothetical protein C4297_04305 [Gemmataceae bacterium]